MGSSSTSSEDDKPEKISPPAPRIDPEAFIDIFEGARSWDDEAKQSRGNRGSGD